MSYYKGPRLDINNFQRESDGSITVKVSCMRSIMRKGLNCKQIYVLLLVGLWLVLVHVNQKKDTCNLSRGEKEVFYVS